MTNVLNQNTSIVITKYLLLIGVPQAAGLLV